MRRQFVIVSLAIAAGMAASSTTASASRDTVVLQPAGPWQLDMAENKCRIARLFGSGEASTAFFIEQWNPDEAAQWTVAGEPLERFSAYRDVEFAFGPGGEEGEFTFVETTLGEFGKAIVNVSTIAPSDHLRRDASADDGGPRPRGLPELDSDRAKDIRSLTLKQRSRDDVVLELGDMQAPLKAMNVCMADLVAHWGFDVDEQKAVVTAPTIRNMRLVAGMLQRHYPQEALRQGAQADFHLRLTIDEAGAIEECLLLNQTLADDFDMSRHPCRYFERHAEIEPARNADGDPVRTYYTTRISYRMPG